MASYLYSGRDNQGKAVSGSIQAGSEQGAARQLQRQGILVVSLKIQQEQGRQRGQTSGSGLHMEFHFGPPISADERLLLTRQLYALTRAGVPIIRAVNGLAETATNPALSDILQDIGESLISGSDLSSAFRQHPKVFSPIFINMVSIGETTGRLSEALERLIAHLDMERETQKRLKTALRYPAMVVTSIVAALSIVTLYVIPNFAPVFASMGSELPLPTRILIASSEIVQTWGVFIAVGVVMVLVALWQYHKTPEGGLLWDRWKLRIPLLGSLYERIALARFARSLAMMIASGVPILRCLAIVSGSLGNRYIGAAIQKMQAGVERGERLTSTAANTGLFTPLVLQMMAVGEETGSIDRLMNDVADFYEEEIDYDLKQLADAIEPILLVFMGALVLVLALGVFLPVWELGRAAKGG
ncbi:type II secretion system F family protein [Parathalassolituus penaei]|uniref:Type II secretion system F family protein n=1 Tax=Parathalassolituus penaei TaxID=2997323 RepID=A0A9X3EBJ6_9GAMM|nr:type II secretion system F family protein [Parathalassolituus penaei]MCY0964185.1 type II secretion system F family protein [Parathalassolituus penaei]